MIRLGDLTSRNIQFDNARDQYCYLGQLLQRKPDLLMNVLLGDNWFVQIDGSKMPDRFNHDYANDFVVPIQTVYAPLPVALEFMLGAIVMTNVSHEEAKAVLKSAEASTFVKNKFKNGSLPITTKTDFIGYNHIFMKPGQTYQDNALGDVVAIITGPKYEPLLAAMKPSKKLESYIINNVVEQV